MDTTKLKSFKNIIRNVVTEEKAKTVSIGGKTYHPPFRNNHHWVEDSKRNNIGEHHSPDVAKHVAELLNDKHYKTDKV